MQIYIVTTGDFESVNYQAGIQSVDDRIAQRMIAASFAKNVKDVYATLDGGLLDTIVPESGNDFDVVLQKNKVLPKRTGKKKWTNIANGVNYPNVNALGGRENIFRFPLYVRDAVKQGQLCRFKVSARADYGEGLVGITANRNLSGTTVQLMLEYPLQADELTPTYANNGSAVNYTFGTEAMVEFYFTAPADIPEDSWIHGWCFAQGKVPVSGGSTLSFLVGTGPNQITSSTPAGQYIGDLVNSKLTVNGAWALFTEGPFTAMSAATRKALTTITDAATLGGQLYTFTPFALETVTDRQCGVSISDSTDQTGGSTFSRHYDLLLTAGISGAFVALEHPVLKLSSANDSRGSWVSNPERSEFRRSQIQFGTFICDFMGKNDIGSFVAGGTEFGIVTQREQFLSIAELQGYPIVGYTIPPFSTSTSNSLESAPFTDGRLARQLLNQAVLKDKRLLHVFKMDELLRNPANINQLRPYTNLRTVTGSTSGNILTLDAGYSFYPYQDAGVPIGSPDWGGSGVMNISRAGIVLSETKMRFPTNFATNLPTGTSFVIGACMWTNWVNDKIHFSDATYLVSRECIGWGGRGYGALRPMQIQYGITC